MFFDSEVEDSLFSFVGRPVFVCLFVCLFVCFKHVFLSSRLGNWVDSEVEDFYFVSLVDPLFSLFFFFYHAHYFCFLAWKINLLVKQKTFILI